MLAKCANPICGAHFRYLSQGRVFNVPLYGTVSAGGASENGTEAGAKWCAYPQRVEHYWLCAECFLTMTLFLRNGKVAVRPRFRQLTDGNKDKAIPAAA